MRYLSGITGLPECQKSQCSILFGTTNLKTNQTGLSLCWSGKTCVPLPSQVSSGLSYRLTQSVQSPEAGLPRGEVHPQTGSVVVWVCSKTDPHALSAPDGRLEILQAGKGTELPTQRCIKALRLRGRRMPLSLNLHLPAMHSKGLCRPVLCLIQRNGIAVL